MPRQCEISALILDREPRANNALMLSALSRERGLVFLFKKMSAKKTSIAPDLFEEISALAQMPTMAEETAPVFFISEFDSVKSRRDISTSYEKLKTASQIADMVKSNGTDMGETAAMFDFVSKALDSIVSSQNLDAVRLKFIYLLAKAQGYPVREDFFRRLSPSDRNGFCLMLKTPSAELGGQLEEARRLLDMLTRWTLENTDIVL